MPTRPPPGEHPPSAGANQAEQLRMSPPGNREEPLIRRLARSKAMQGSREASMSPTRVGARSTSQPPVKNQQMGSYYTTENGSIVQYIPYSFIYPGNANNSNSLPSLPGVQIGNADRSLRRQPTPCFPPTEVIGLPHGQSHRRLSKMSNLLWTSSVSQPDLTMTTTSTTMSPSTSQPTSRASSPVPPSISARGTPGQGPSPYISPLGSGSLFYQDLSCLSQALNQLGVAQNFGFPGSYQQALQEHRSSSQQSLHDLNGNDPNTQYIVQQQVNDSARAPVLQSIQEGAPTQRPHHDGYHTSGSPLPLACAQGDPSAWYCQYVSLPPGVSSQPRADGMARPHEPRGQSSSPQRLVNLSPQRVPTSKPCAVITPQLVSAPRKPHEPVIGGNEALVPGDSSPLEIERSQVGASSSVLAQNLWDSNLYGPQPETQRSDNSKANSPAITPLTSIQDISCPDVSFTSSSSPKISVGTSCSDLPSLDAEPPFILETCQICNVFHGTGSMALESQHPNTPYFKFRPCSYGLQVVSRGEAVHLQDGNHCQIPSCENANQLDNAPTYEGDYKLTTTKLEAGTQLATKGSVAMDRLKR